MIRPSLSGLFAIGLALAITTQAFEASGADFETWLAKFREEARMKGITEATLNDGLRDLKPIPRVIELDRKQPEFTLTFDDYMKRVVTQTRIRKARERYTKHANILKRVWMLMPRCLCHMGF